MNEHLLASIFQTVGRLEAGQRALDEKVDTLVATVSKGDDALTTKHERLELRVRMLERYKARVMGWAAGAAAVLTAGFELFRYWKHP